MPSWRFLRACQPPPSPERLALGRPFCFRFLRPVGAVRSTHARRRSHSSNGNAGPPSDAERRIEYAVEPSKTHLRAWASSTQRLSSVSVAGTSAETSEAWSTKASPAQLTERLGNLEQREREDRNLARRAKIAALGTTKMLDRFDWNHPRTIDRELFDQLHSSLDFIPRGENSAASSSVSDSVRRA